MIPREQAASKSVTPRTPRTARRKRETSIFLPRKRPNTPARSIVKPSKTRLPLRHAQPPPKMNFGSIGGSDRQVGQQLRPVEAAANEGEEIVKDTASRTQVTGD